MKGVHGVIGQWEKPLQLLCISLCKIMCMCIYASK